MESGEAIYFDGSAALRRTVRIELQPLGIAIFEAGALAAVWTYTDLRRSDGPAGTLRIASAGAAELARLEVRDDALRDAILARCPELGRRRRGVEAGAGRIVFWSLAAVVSIALTVIYLVPLAADRLAPLIPYSAERRLGEAVDGQVRSIFGADACAAADGQAALARLSEQLTQDAGLPMPVEIAVLPSRMENAFAVPGGRVYLLRGLIQGATTPDELAGVLAHELGHVAGRDGLRVLLQRGGSAFLLGLLFGDVTGGGVLVFGAQILVDSSYSREAETAADAFAIDRMLAVGRSPRPLGEFLTRMSSEANVPAFLSSHPVTVDRVRAFDAADRPATGAPLLSENEWRALKAICGDAEDGGGEGP